MMPRYSSRGAHALFIIAIVVCDHAISARRIPGHSSETDSGADMGVEDDSLQENELTDVQSSPNSMCRDPARYQVECLTWRSFCPNPNQSQPLLFDQFMIEWCPKTCGICLNDVKPDENSEDFDIGEFAGGEEATGKKCVDTMVSRRRNSPGTLCSCRRRSGTSGLSVGWACDEEQNHIVYEGTEDLKRDATCCCKKKQCSYESIRRGDSVSHMSADGTPWCCKVKIQSWIWGGCPKNSGYSWEQNLSMCTRAPVKPSVSSCSNRLVLWLSDQNWYKTVGGWEIDEDSYAAYIPCVISEDVHVMSIMLGVTNALARVSMTNPMRAFITLQPECTGLSGLELIQAVTASYRELCPFGMPHSSYKPDLVTEGTCAYDHLDKSISLQEDRMCAEGHRCACPMFEANSEVVQSAYDAYATYSVAFSVTKGANSAAAGAAGLTGMIASASIPAGAATAIGGAVGGVSSAGAVAVGALAAYAWPLTVGVGAVSLVTFAGSYVWKWARHACSRNVGCYPMDCVEEPGRGCRIRAPDDFMDERNPFWFLPPPTYKCAYKKRSCQLSPCSKSNVWLQTIGLGQTRSLGKTGNTQVYNCQPMLYTDMSAGQRVRLETETADLKKEYETARRINQRMRRALEESCPWSRPTKDNVFRCKNHQISCTGRYKDQSCCDHYGGILQCPENFPLFCMDGYCGNDEDLCEERGGVRPCPTADECPWMLPSPVVGHAECQDGNYSRGGWITGACQREGYGGIRRCPWDKPVMCNNRTCSGDYCCAQNCKDLDGPRECNVSKVWEDKDSDGSEPQDA